MRVFITGATGYIGSALVRELVAAGHEVTGLVRSQEKAAALEELGGRPVLGDLKQPDTWRQAAAESDAAVHAAFEYSAQTVDADRTAVETLLDVARSSGTLRQVVYTSGIWVLGASPGETYEDAPTDHPAPLVAWRVGHERQILDVDGDALATAVVRPGMVYGHEGSLIARYFETAEKSGAADYVGDGQNHLPMIHVDDLARFYRAVLEKKGRGVFHAVDGVPVRTIEVAEAASRAAGKGGETRALSPDDARKKVGGLVDALVLDQKILSRRAEELGWKPQRCAFVEEAERAYSEWKASTGR